MGLVVTGISQTPDLAPVEAALRAAGYSLEPLQIIEAEDGAPIGGPGLATGGNIGPIETGTGVPGLTGSRTTTGLHTGGFMRDEALLERLGALEIPDDEIENYLEAIFAGRSVVAYFAKSDTVDGVIQAFRAAGLAKVKRF